MFASTVTFVGLMAVANGFASSSCIHREGMQQLEAISSRREVVFSAAAMASLFGLPQTANAKAASTFFLDETIETVREPSQMYTGGKLDLNAAFVVSD